MRRDIKGIRNGIGTPTSTSRAGFERVEREVRSSSSQARKDTNHVTKLISVSSKENKRRLDDLHSSIRQNDARRNNSIAFHHHARATKRKDESEEEDSEEEDSDEGDKEDGDGAKQNYHSYTSDEYSDDEAIYE